MEVMRALPVRPAQDAAILAMTVIAGAAHRTRRYLSDENRKQTPTFFESIERDPVTARDLDLTRFRTK